MANRWKPFGSLLEDLPVSSPRAKPEQKGPPARQPKRAQRCSAHQLQLWHLGLWSARQIPQGPDTSSDASVLMGGEKGLRVHTVINSANAAKYKSTWSKNPILKLCLTDTSLICRHSKDAWIANSSWGCFYSCSQSQAMEHIPELPNTQRSYYELQMSVPQSKSCFISLKPGGEGRRNSPSCCGCTEEGWASHH